MFGSVLAGDEVGFGFADLPYAVKGPALKGDFPEASLGAGPAIGWQIGEDLVHLGVEADVGVSVLEEFEYDFEAGDGLEGARHVFGDAVVVEVVDEMGDMVLELFGMVVKIVGDSADELYGVGGEVFVVFPAIEVAGWGTGAARAEFVVTIGTAQEAVAHGPVAATGFLTAAFVGIGGHFSRSSFGGQPLAISYNS